MKKIILLIFLISCNKNNKNYSEVIYSPNLSKIENINYDSVYSNFPKRWITLFLKNNRYVVYHRNRSVYGRIIINSDSLKDYGGQEAIKWLISDFSKINDSTYLFLLGDSAVSKIYSTEKWFILNQDTLTSVIIQEVWRKNNSGQEQLIGQYQRLCVPEESITLFENIYEDDYDPAKSNLKFDKINFGKLLESRSQTESK